MLSDVKFGRGKSLKCLRNLWGRSVGVGGPYALLDAGNGRQGLAEDQRQASHFPPEGIYLPIVLGDETVINSTVVSSSPTRIVLELDSGHLRCLTPGASGLSPRGFPGSEWIVQLRV